MYGACRLVLLRRLLLGCALCVVGVLGLVIAPSAFASTPGYYTGTSPNGASVRTGTLVAAAQLALAECEAAHGYAYNCHLSTTSEPSNPLDGHQYSAVAGYTSVGGNSRGWTIVVTYHGCPGGQSYSPDHDGCWSPPDCSAAPPRIFEEFAAGKDQDRLTIRISHGADDQGKTTRVGPDGCGYSHSVQDEPINCYTYKEGSKSGLSYCAFRYQSTGEYLGTGGAADSSPPSNDPAVPTDSKPCVTGDGGTIACSSPSDKGGQDCGFVNGHQVCAPSVPDSGCQSLGSTSSSICGAQASPPVDPETNQPAVPVDNVDLQSVDDKGNPSTKQTVIYDAGGDGDSPSSGDSGGTGTGSSSGSGSGSGSSAADGTCNPSVDPAGCGDSGSGEGTFKGDSLDDVPSFGDSLDTFWTTVSSGGIVGAVSGMTFTDQAGECPKPVFTFFGNQYTMDAQCTIMANAGSTLDALVYAMWGLLALFILLSA